MAGFVSTLVRRIPQIINLSTPFINTQNTLRALSTSNTLFIPRIQHPAPDFEGIAVVHDTFKTIKLSDYRGKYLLIMFYPLDFTFVCPTELTAIEDVYDDFQKHECEVVAVSVDSHFTHLAWQKTPRDQGGLGRLSYPLLSDLNKTMARDYDVLLPNDGIALRGSFVIDPKGILRSVQINDLPIGRSTKEALRLVEAIRTVDEIGEVCPANWTKGQKTIKPDPKGSLEYFDSVNKK